MSSAAKRLLTLSGVVLGLALFLPIGGESICAYGVDYGTCSDYWVSPIGSRMGPTMQVSLDVAGFLILGYSGWRFDRKARLGSLVGVGNDEPREDGQS